MAYILTPEEFASVISFVNGESNDVLKTDVPKRFMSLSNAFQSKILEAMYSAKSECRAKTRALERAQGRIADKVNAGEFGELHLNSIDFAMAIVFLLRSVNRYEGVRQVNFILYQFYARWLHVSTTRPWENDRPVLQEWGPQFWGAANRLQKSSYPTGSHDDLKKIAEYEEFGPAMVNILKNVVTKYGTNMSERELQKECLDSFPYQNALKRKQDAGTKWGEKISDTELYWWKQ